jgi:hypothetical protein
MSSGVQTLIGSTWNQLFGADPPPPVTAAVMTLGEGTCPEFVIDKTSNQVPLPPSDLDRTSHWAKSVDAIPADFIEHVVTVQGRDRHRSNIVLQSMRVEIVRSTRPATGKLYALDVGCGAGLSPRYFDLALDSQHPVLEAKPGVGPGGRKIPAVDFPFTVSSTSSEQFRIVAISDRHDVQWRLHLSYTSNGETHDLVIDDDGSPFRLTPAAGDVDYYANFTKGSWGAEPAPE